MSNDPLKPLAKLSEYPYGTEFQLKLLALAFREPKFINEYEQVLAPTYFDTDEFKHLAKIALEHFRNYGQSIDTGLVFDAIDSYCRSNRFSEAVKDRLVNTFGKLVDEDLSSGEWVRDKALQFAQSQAVKEALVRGVRSIDDTENFPKIIADLESAIGMNAPKRSSVNFRDIAHEIPLILRETSVYSRANRIPTGIPTIDDAMFGGPARRKLGLIMAPSGVGKLVADHTPVLTTNGWKTHGALKVGDYVFGIDGLPTRVVALSKKDKANIRVEMTDGSVFYCHENHEWTVYDRSGSRRCWRTIETNKLLNSKVPKNGTNVDTVPCLFNTRSRFQLPVVPPIELPEIDLPMEPYVLGAWLGDGTSSKPCITHAASDMKVIEKIQELGYTVSSVQIHPKTGVHTTYFGGEFDHIRHVGITGRFRKELREAGVFKNKHIPTNYLNSGRKQREELLAGLIDTDGSFSKEGKVKITTCFPELASQIQELVRSLGFRAWINVYEPRLSTSGIQGRKKIYAINFVPYSPIPTVLTRKKIIGSPHKKKKIGIRGARFDDQGFFGRCIQVEREDGLYLIGKELIPTHNSHMLTNLGANAIRFGFSVFHFTFGDMEDIEVLVRYAGNFTGINTQNIFSGNGSDYDASIVEVLKSVSADLFVSTHPADTITTSQLNSMISRMIAQTGVKPGMVVVDYADNLATGMKYTSDPGEISARMGHTYQQLAKIAAKYDVLVWTGSQVKLPNWGDDIITNAGIARSVSKIEHVDYNITINQNQAEHEQNIARLFTAKTRFGKDKAIVPVHFDKSTSRITEMDESETEEFEVKRKDRTAPKKRRLATIKKQMDDGDDGEELPADEKKDLLASVLKKAIQ